MSSWKELKDNPRLKEIYIKRLEIIRLIREFFWQQNFLETETPLALKLPGQEPYLNPLPITIHNTQQQEFRFFLHTSPEFAMKKLLATGLPKIFQITKCFRDYENFGGNHNTEFTMIEWYRAPGIFQEIMSDTEELFKFVGRKLGIEKLKYRDREVSLFCHSDPPRRTSEVEESLKVRTSRDSSARASSVGMTDKKWDRKTMKEIWKQYVEVDLDNYLTIDALKTLVQEKEYETAGKETYEDLFFTIFLNMVEPHLGTERPIFVYDYPRQLCSLSQACKHDDRYAERFELYIGGLEIANAFGELVNGGEQNKRLVEDRGLRQKLGKETWAIDEDFIQALQSGIPSASGIALGIDRMVMLFTGAKNIDEVMFQSVSDQLSV